MIKKVVVIGPESTGKSTLSSLLANHYQTSMVAEYARAYINDLPREYGQEDLPEIARGQLREEDAQLEKAQNGLLICDTDLYVIKVWSEHSYHTCATWILTEIARRKYDLYLLTFIDTPWEDDPQREHPEPEMRTYFYKIYKDIVLNSGVPWADIRGTYDERLARAIAAVDELQEA